MSFKCDLPSHSGIMNVLLLAPTIIMCFLTATFACHQYTDDYVHLINRINDFYGFDHNVFLMDSVIDRNCWSQQSSLISETKFTPQTVYTVEDFSDTVRNHFTASKFIILVIHNTKLASCIDDFDFIKVFT